MTRTVTFLFPLLLVLLSPFAHAVSVDDLMKRSMVQEVQLSPDGKHLAFRVFMEGKTSLRFLDRKTMKVVGGFNLSGQSEVGDYFWVNNERVVGRTMRVPTWQETPRNEGELFAVNYDGSQPKLLFGYRSGGNATTGPLRKSRSEYATANIVSLLHDDPHNVLISKKPFSSHGRSRNELMRLNVDDGSTKSLHLFTQEGFGGFYIDREGHARIITSVDEDNNVHIRTLPDVNGDWIDMSKTFGKRFQPVSLTSDDKYLYALDNSDTDTTGLFKISLDGKERQQVYVNKDVDITTTSTTTDGKRIYAIRIDDGYPSYLLLPGKKEGEAAIFKALLNVFAGNKVYITSSSRDGQYWVVYTQNDRDPGSFYLFDRDKKKLRLLVKAHEGLDSNELSPMKPIKFTSFDGLTINGYFTPAITKSKKPAPMIVYVHGGPRARDYWSYNPEVQILATNGYSVLQINYRGSTGYGDKFMHMGDHEWGNKVQKDIIAGTRWAIDQKMARAGKVCIMGGSFGAYSAVQSAEMAPDLYSCVIANAGIYDLKLLYTKGDIPQAYTGKNFLEEAIGSDEAQLAAYSPVNHVDKLKAPVLIAHGKKDPRAPFAHAVELREAMDKAHKPYEWFIRGKEGHGFYNINDEREYMKTVLAFLKKHT